MNSSCIPVKVTFFTTDECRSKESFSLNPSGLRSLSNVIGVRIPGIGKFAAGQSKSSGGPRIKGEESAVESDGLAIEEVSQRLVGRGRIAEGPGGQRDSGEKSSFSLPSKPKADPETSANPVLECHPARRFRPGPGRRR